MLCVPLPRAHLTRAARVCFSSASATRTAHSRPGSTCTSRFTASCLTKRRYALAGSITIAFGAIFFLVCPDSIATSGRYFNERERAQLQARLQTNGAADTRFHADQLIEAVLDLRIWLMLTMAAAICPCEVLLLLADRCRRRQRLGHGLWSANHLVRPAARSRADSISTFGYTSLEALALQIPGGAATCVSIYLAGWTVGRYKNITTYVLAAWCIPPIIGCVGEV